MLIVPAALVLVAQHGVGALDLLESLGGHLLRSTRRQWRLRQRRQLLSSDGLWQATALSL